MVTAKKTTNAKLSNSTCQSPTRACAIKAVSTLAPADVGCSSS